MKTAKEKLSEAFQEEERERKRRIRQGRNFFKKDNYEDWAEENDNKPKKKK